MTRTLKPALALLVALCACGGSSSSKPDPVTPPAPEPVKKEETADSVLARYVEVTGGEAKYRSIQSMVQKGTLDIKPAGVKGSVTITVEGNKLLGVFELAGVGTIRQGSDGETVWAMDPMTGARIITGVERNQLLRSLDLLAMFHRDKYYKSVTLEGTEEVAGKPAHVIKLVDVDDLPETQYYDVESGLLVKTTGVQQSQMGEMKSTTTITDYGEFDGFKVPVATEATIGPMTQVLKVEAVEINPTIDPATFALPPEIAELKKKAAAN